MEMVFLKILKVGLKGKIKKMIIYDEQLCFKFCYLSKPTADIILAYCQL